MRGKTAALFALALFVVLTTPSGARANLLEKFCADRWPGDYAMIKRCVDSQLRAVNKINRFRRRYDIRRKVRQQTKMDPYENMYLDCAINAEMPNNDDIDFVKFIRCLDKKEKAYNARHGIAGGDRRGPYGEPPGDRLEDKLSPFE